MKTLKTYSAVVLGYSLDRKHYNTFFFRIAAASFGQAKAMAEEYPKGMEFKTADVVDSFRVVHTEVTALEMGKEIICR